MANEASQPINARPSFGKKHRRYLMVFIAFIEFFIVCGPTFNYSILFVSFQEEFSSSAALTGWVGSLANAVFGCGGPISAPLIHRYGPRMITLVGAVIFSAGLFTTSFVPALSYAYLTFGLLVGLGTNFIFQAGMTLVYEWFTGKTCSRGTSLALMGTSFSVLVYAPLLNALIGAHGWRTAIRILSGGSLVVALTHGALITTPQQTQTPTDDKYGHEVDAYRDVVDDHTQQAQNLANCSVVNGKSEQATQTPASWNTVDGQLHEAQTLANLSEVDDMQEQTLTEHDVVDDLPQQTNQTLVEKFTDLVCKVDPWLWFTSLVLLNLGWTFIIVNYASFMEYDLHFTSDHVSITFVLFAVGEIVGKVLFSLFGDHLPFLKLFVVAVGSLLGGGASGLMTVLRTVPLMYTSAVFLGLCRAASFAMPYPATMELFADYGSDVATIISLMPFGVGVLIGAPISGGLYDLTGNYTLSLLVILAIFTCSAGLVLIIPIRRWIQSRIKRARSFEEKSDSPKNLEF